MPAIRKETVTAIGDLVCSRTGLWAGPPTHQRLERLIRQRMALGQYRHPSEYYHFVRSNPYGRRELDKLAAGLTARKPRLMNTELASLVRVAGARWAGAYRPAVLAVGTAAAEDIYTAAMVLDQAGADASAPDAVLAAADIDLDRLLRGSTGIYTSRAVTGLPAEMLGTYLETLECGRFRVRRRLRERVRWLYVNPAEGRLPVNRQWDLVLCRELLGRLSVSVHGRWRALGRLAAPGGLIICDRRFDFAGVHEAGQSGRYWTYARPADEAAIPPLPADSLPEVAFERLLRVPAGDTLDAIERELAEALRDDPFDAAKCAAMGLAHIRKQRPAQAREAASSALELAPCSPQVLFSCGIIYESLNNPSTAEKLYRKALFVQPSLAAVQLRLADLLEKRGREADAQQAYARAAELLEQLKRGCLPGCQAAS